jgi:hypothetical protein
VKKSNLSVTFADLEAKTLGKSIRAVSFVKAAYLGFGVGLAEREPWIGIHDSGCVWQTVHNRGTDNAMRTGLDVGV